MCFDDQVPCECPQVGRARGVVFQDLCGMERLLEVGSLGFILTGPNLDHGLDVADRERPRLMVGLREWGVKARSLNSEFGIRNFHSTIPRERDKRKSALPRIISGFRICE